MIRILELLRNKTIQGTPKEWSARQLVNACTDDKKNYKGHSSATVYKALKRLQHFMFITKIKLQKDGRGRPYSVYALRNEKVTRGIKNKEDSLGKMFAKIMFDKKESKEKMFRSYRANLVFFAQEMLVERILHQLRDPPLEDKKQLRLLNIRIKQSIEMDCEELKAFSKKYIELIFKRFGLPPQ